MLLVDSWLLNQSKKFYMGRFLVFLFLSVGVSTMTFGQKGWEIGTYGLGFDSRSKWKEMNIFL